MQNKNLVMNTYVFEELMKEGQYQIQWLEQIKDLGIQTVEIRREYLRDNNELAELKEKAIELDMTLFYAVPDVLFPGVLMTKETLRQYFDEYSQLGAKQFKIVAGYDESINDVDVESLKELMTEYGVLHLTLENDQEAYSTPSKMKKILDKLKDGGIDVGMTFDTGNFLATGQSPIETAKALQEEVTFIHMKNIKADTKAMTLIDEGDIPMFELLGIFSEDVNRAIEYPCGNKPFETVKGEIEKIKQNK